MNKWNSSNALWMLLYTILYIVGTFVVCVTGMIHPIFFVCYQITAGVVLTGILIRAFYRVKSPGAAVYLATGMIIMLFIIKDASAWHVVPLIIIAAATEIIRYIFKYNWSGNLLGAVIMSFSTFGYYGRIWFHRDFTYKVAAEEMSKNYADTLMSVSPVWALPVVLIVGIVLSVVVTNLTAKFFKMEKK